MKKLRDFQETHLTYSTDFTFSTDEPYCYGSRMSYDVQQHMLVVYK